MDLAELRESINAHAAGDHVWTDALSLANLYDRIYTLPKPTIAAVNGTAVAGGAGLVSVCDLAIAAPDAKFGYPEVRRGLVAAMVLPHLLRHVGERLARYLLLTGELIDAAAAERCGFVNEAVPADRLLPRSAGLGESARRGRPAGAGGNESAATPILAASAFDRRGREGECRAAFERRVPAGADSILREKTCSLGLGISAWPILGVGEVLWDLLPSGPRLGGAPGNFAFHCQQLGHPSRIVSRIGGDERGVDLRAALHDLGISLESIQSDPNHPTGTVSVAIDDRGQPHYTITANVAWDYLEWQKPHEDLSRAAPAICFGSLAQRCPVSRATIRQILDDSRHTERPPLRVFDMNLRQDFFDRDTIDESLQRCDWLKLNDDELEILLNLFAWPHVPPANTLARLRKRYSLDLVCLTRGEHGCLVQTAAEEIALPGMPIQVADTVGAGDAFTAGLLCLTLEGQPVQAAEFANRYAARVAAEVGGTPRIDRREIAS